LCQNLKHSLTSVKDLEIYLIQCVNSEETYVKVINKMLNQLNKFSSNGSFSPMWSSVKEFNERNVKDIQELVRDIHDLIKEIQRYNDELRKKIAKIRDNEQQTQNIVQTFQEIQQTLNKNRESYHSLRLEFERQRSHLDAQQLAQLNNNNNSTSQPNMSGMISPTPIHNSNLLSMGANNNLQMSSNLALASQTNNNTNNNINNTNTSNNNNSSALNITTTTTTTTTTERLTSLATSITVVSKVSQVQKLERKVKAAYDDYKQSIDRYNQTRIDFERKLADSCEHFQFAEEVHLNQMRSFIENYIKLIFNLNAAKQNCVNEFQRKFEKQFTTEFFLQTFMENKRTGIDKPEPVYSIDNENDNNTIAATLQQLQQGNNSQNLSGDNGDSNLFSNNAINSTINSTNINNSHYTQLNNDSMDGRSSVGDSSLFNNG
jgi:hypothetical protein